MKNFACHNDKLVDKYFYRIETYRGNDMLIKWLGHSCFKISVDSQVDY